MKVYRSQIAIAFLLIDNCLTQPNRSQVDTDGEGFGNACNPDFNNDGKVDGRDEEGTAAAEDPCPNAAARAAANPSNTSSLLTSYKPQNGDTLISNNVPVN